jgi:hypothetical protein
MVKVFWRAETAIFLGSWLLLMVIGRDGFLRDPGTLWHPVVGRRILESGRFIERDPFSCTFAGKPWIVKDWLAECGMALLDRIGGLDSLLVTFLLLLAGLYTWVAHRLLQAGLHWLLTVPLVALTILASIYHFHPRPHVFTIVLLGWTFAQLIDVEAGRIPLRRLFWLVPLFVVWTNLHAGMVGGVATLGLAVAGWGLAWLLGAGSPIRSVRQLLTLSVLVVACALTALVNPYGVRLLEVWAHLSSSPVLPRIMLEHMPLKLSERDDRMVVLLALVYLLSLAATWPGRPPHPPLSPDDGGEGTFISLAPDAGGEGRVRGPRVCWLIPLVWLVLSFKSIRHGPLFAISAVLALADLLPFTRWAQWLARHSDYLYVPPSADRQMARAPLARAWFALPVGLLALSLSVQAAGVELPVVGRHWAVLNPQYWPVELRPQLQAYVDECRKRNPERQPCIFNDMLYGGYLIRYVPDLKVFLDDRCELYGDAFLEKVCAKGAGGASALRALLDENHIDIALVGPDREVVSYFESAADWEPVREGVRFKLTGESLKRLEAAGVAEAVLAKLDIMKDREFDTADRFLTQLGQHLEKDELHQYRKRLLNHAQVGIPRLYRRTSATPSTREP